MKWLVFKIIQRLSFSKIFWNRKEGVYLTFDDGPHSENTPLLLDILATYNAKATFFVIGEYAEKNINTLSALFEAGHTVANHSYSHMRYDGGLKSFLDNIKQCESVLKKANIPSKKYIRIPYGTVNMKLFIGLLIKGYKIAFWNKDTKDYKLKNPQQVAEYVDINKLKNGDVVLLHDFPEVTPHILENILKRHSDKSFVAM